MRSFQRLVFLPSQTDSTDEISRYVIYNYEEDSWSIGSLERYAWLNPGINEKPLAQEKHLLQKSYINTKLSSTTTQAQWMVCL